MTFHRRFSALELEWRFELEDEYLAQGKSIKDKAFFQAMRQRFEERQGANNS